MVASTAFTLSRPVSDGRRLTSLLTPSEWLNQNGLSRLVEGFVKWFVSPIPYGGTIFVVLCGCAILVNVLVRRHPSRGIVANGTIALALGIILEILTLSWMRYIATNNFDGALPIFLLDVRADHSDWRNSYSIHQSSRILTSQNGARSHFGLVTLWCRGWPSTGRLRTSLDRCYGAYSQEILRDGVTHFAGTYWTVWPAVFHVNLRLHGMGSDRKIWGITDRSEDTRDLWDTFTDRANLIGAPSDQDITPYLDGFDVMTEDVQTHNQLRLYRSIPRKEIQLSTRPLWPRVPTPGLASGISIS